MSQFTQLKTDDLKFNYKFKMTNDKVNNLIAFLSKYFFFTATESNDLHTKRFFCTLLHY